MTYLLLLANADGVATTAKLDIRSLREFSGDAGISVHFRPVRNDALFDSAKAAGRLAYRILTGEGIVRSQLWVEYESPGTHFNVTGRSSDLLFALALIMAKWKPPRGRYPAVAATGALNLSEGPPDSGGAVFVGSVKHTVAKVAAAVMAFADVPDAVVFFPEADADGVATWRAETGISTHVRLQPVASLEAALGFLGISLEKAYLGNPFRGFEHFDYAHRAIFFGRDSETTEVLRQLLRREANRVPGLVVEGASGSGKSSFLRAGVLAALVHPASQPADIQEALSRCPVRESVGQAIWRAGLLPLRADEARLAHSVRDCWRTLPELAGRLNDGDNTFASLTRERRNGWPEGQRFVWVLDQLEALFSLELEETVVEAFGCFLVELQADGVWTLACIRADAVPELKRRPPLRKVYGPNEGQYYLETIGATALDDVITRPAQVAGLTFGMSPSGRRLDRILREDAYRDRDNALPLLQFVLNELYQRRIGSELPHAVYEHIGGLSGSVATTAVAILQSEDAETQSALPRLFRSLVTVDDSGGAMRRYATSAEIAADPSRQRLLVRLVQARLCVTDQRDGEGVVAFAHEALLRTWPALAAWLKEEAALLQSRELAQRETRLWLQHGRSDDWLASSDKLANFKALEAAGIAVPDPVRDFVRRSVARARRATLVQQAVVTVIVLLAVVAAGAGLVAIKRQHEAEAQAAETLKAQAQLLTEAAAQRLSNWDVAGAQAIILEVLTSPRFGHRREATAINVFQEARAADAQIAVLSGHVDVVESATYSPDGTRIVTASDDKTARIWDARTGVQLAVLSGHGGAVTSAAYSPDGTHIVTASNDKSARVWDARTGAQIAVLSGHTSVVKSAAFSPDGTRIVTASWDTTARIWNAHTGAQLAVVAVDGSPLQSAAFSPDGSRIVTASHDMTARTWDARTRRRIASILFSDAIVESMAYSPDGAIIATASRDKMARVWDARTGARIADLSGHGAYVKSVAFSPDGARIVTASYDKTARIWDARTGAQRAVLSGHADRVQTAAFSPDGTRVVTASLDGTARVWDARMGAQAGILAGHGAIGSAKYSSDGMHILTASTDRTAQVWDTRTGALLAVLPSHGFGINAADFSPGGARVVTAGTDRTARVLDAQTGVQLAVLSGHDGDVLSAAYSPDGSHIVTASDDKTARVWDARTGDQLAVLSGHDGSVRWAVYSRDGSRIATASWDKTARIWDSRTGIQLGMLAGHSDSVSSVDYSPDGQRIVTASYDKTARVWDARTGSSLAVLLGNRGVVESVAYSPDGSQIVTASLDKTVRIWDANTGMQLQLLTGHDDLIETASYSPDGTRVVTASDDRTARIWDARVPASLEAQITWGSSAQTDPPSEADRTRLGLIADSRVRSRSTIASACDHSAAAYYDPDRLAAGTAQSAIGADIAISACSAELKLPEHLGRTDYQMGRALVANGDMDGARRQFELALAKGYRAAQIDLADVLTRASAASIDTARAEALYERAWRDGVLIAAFDLGELYERGVATADGTNTVAIPRDLTRAWDWYQKGAAAGEPTALARIASREEMAAVFEVDPVKRNARLLEAFRFYAAAADRADGSQWPDNTWRQWRHRRATLARLLALDGMMQQVADISDQVRNGRALQMPTS